jgi:MinD-like ATPase involved in chromosome partitioning or flagellar assembly
MGTVLLTVEHQAETFDVLVADDEPIDAILPSVLAAAGMEPGELRWRLADADGVLLRGTARLNARDLGRDGKLRLVADGALGQPAPLHIAEPFRGPPSPAARTAALLPPRHSLPVRLGLTLQALLRPRDDRPVELADHRSGPSPADLTLARPLGRRARARATWRETGYERSLEPRIVGPRLVRCATIAVVSPKGGVGKTTITALLGTLLAQLRRDRIVAIDTNPDYGSLGRTLAPTHTVFVDDLLEVLDHPALTVTQLEASLARGPHGLLVLPAPTSPERMARIDQYGYTRVIQKLQPMVSVIILDCGTGLWEPAAQVALAAADQVVLVSDAEPATASLVAEAAQQLRALETPVTLVVNRASGGSRLDIERFGQSMRWAQHLVTLGNEPPAAAAINTGGFDWDRAPRSWRVSTRELAAVVAGDWDRLGLTI